MKNKRSVKNIAFDEFVGDDFEVVSTDDYTEISVPIPPSIFDRWYTEAINSEPTTEIQRITIKNSPAHGSSTSI